jgi:hypothetical protein
MQSAEFHVEPSVMPRLGQKLVDRQDKAGFWTVAEAARRSGFCERTIRDWMRKGTIRVRRVGPALVFVEKASLAAATGGGEADAEILADVAGARRPSATPAARPVRELTLERDE